MILRDALAQGTARLRGAGIEGAARDAQILLAHVLETQVVRLSLEPSQILTKVQQADFEAALTRRIGRAPVSKIIGKRSFWGRDFIVTPDVLDPRPETETLIAAALEGPKPSRLLDLGTGSGALAITLLAEWADTTAVATDVSEPALGVARMNAMLIGVSERLRFLTSDWFTSVDGRFDLIVSNPPYISEEEMNSLAPEVLDHDPLFALTSGGDGLSAYQTIAEDVLTHLVPSGRILVEIGHRQGPAVRDIFVAAGLVETKILPDMDGRDRVVSASAPVS